MFHLLAAGLCAVGLSFSASCSGGNESPVAEQPPSPVARLAAQACACQTLECITPLQTQLAGIIAAQHSGANAAKDNADATAKVAACMARLKAQ